jgi:hypothetical protein
MAIQEQIDQESDLIIKNVKRYGWHATYIRIPATSDKPSRGWCFTVGMHYTYKHPEILICGEEKRTYRALSCLARAIAAGAVFAHGKEYLGIIPRVPCVFQTIEKVWYPLFLGSSTNPFFKLEDFPALQSIWSRKGRYPWEVKFTRKRLTSQPLLFYPDAQRAGIANLLRAIRAPLGDEVTRLH